MRRGFENWISVYWCSARVWYEQAEYDTMLYPTELAVYRQRCPQPNLKDYMRSTRGQPR